MSTTTIPQSTRIVLRPDKVELYHNIEELIQGVTQIKKGYFLPINCQIFLDTDLVIDSIQLNNYCIDIRVRQNKKNIVTGQYLIYVTKNNEITSIKFNPVNFSTAV